MHKVIKMGVICNGPWNSSKMLDSKQQMYPETDKMVSVAAIFSFTVAGIVSIYK